MNVTSLDHLVLTVEDLDATYEFYATVLGMEVATFGENRKTLAFGIQRIDLHIAGHELEPNAHRPTPCAADLCFLTGVSYKEVNPSQHHFIIVASLEFQGDRLIFIRTLAGSSQ